MTEEQLYVQLAYAGIAFEKLEHGAVFTVEESAAIHDALPGAHTKNLFLKDKRGAFWLITLPADRRADLKAMAAVLGAGKFSFGKAEDMERLLKVSPGSVTPLAAVNASGGDVQVVFDAAFGSGARIAVHPFRNTATIALAFDPLVEWLTQKEVAVRVQPLP